jgi:N-sulfoglucosamine sulfohydrolase
VPFIVRIPEKYKQLFPAKKAGSQVNRIISFVDLAPTLLSIAGIEIPEYMQGDAFLGDQKTEDPEYAFMFRGRAGVRYDKFRAVRSKNFRYIRNYMPYRSPGHHSEYVMQAPSALSWEQAWLNGKCNEIQSRYWQPQPAEELYDTENDPWEINNLADDPAYKNVLEKMRKANRDWIRRIYDTGFIPEADLVDRLGGTPAYDYMRSGAVDLDEMIGVADIATMGEAENLGKMRDLLKNDDSAIRYWGATGLLILGDQASSATGDLKAALDDKSDNVVIVSAEALYNLGEKQEAEKVLINILKSPNKYACTHALNTIDCLEMKSSPGMVEAMVYMLKSRELTRRDRWDLVTAAKRLFEKWGINPGDYDIGI